ncbi:uncharacterized protein ARMOST_07705 [Armillaria ostoyae]|uniref:Uncharacterized protein n=1 Tax=Armillaria ostoyae TaxID=47428 RepID=A0A284R6M5_ARMOS|nr:uncharacterized protein ARMOST_07705 [Armillaria ostoyae]
MGQVEIHPCEASLQDEQAAPQEENTARITQEKRLSQDNAIFPGTPSPFPLTGSQEGVEQEPPRAEVTRSTEDTRALNQVQPTDSLGVGTSVHKPSSQGKLQGGSLLDAPPERPHQENKEAIADANQRLGDTPTRRQATITKKPQDGAASAQAIWLAKERTPAIAKKGAMSDEPAQSSTKGNEPSSVPPMKSDPSKWYKPFEVDQTLRVVCEARNDNAACVVLFVWTHQDRIPELTDELLELLHKGGDTAQEQLYELCEPPHYLHCRQNNNRDFTLDVQLVPCTGRKTLVAKGLLDSGCTSSSINRTFVQEHGLDTK